MRERGGGRDGTCHKAAGMDGLGLFPNECTSVEKVRVSSCTLFQKIVKKVSPQA